MGYDDEEEADWGLTMSNNPDNMSVFNALEDFKENVWDRAEEYL